MSEHEELDDLLHRLRNELNAVSMGLMVLSTGGVEDHDSLSSARSALQDAVNTLEQIDHALGRRRPSGSSPDPAGGPGI